MTVHIEGKSSGCVTQILLYGLHIITGFERNNGIRVARFVKSHGRHSQFTDHQLECPVQRLGCDACTELVCEDETVFLKQIAVVLSA